MLSFKEAFQYFATSFWNKSKNTFLTIENGINGILLDPKYELVNSVANNTSITLPSLDTFDEIYIEMTNGENTIVHQASVKKGSLLSDNSAITYREILLDGIHDTQSYVTYDIATNTITPSYCEGVAINGTTNVTTSVYVKKYVVSETTTTLSSGIISYDDTKANLGTDNLQGAIEKLDDKIDGIEQTAINTSYNNSTSGLSATNVQNAIDELKSDVSNITLDAENTTYDNTTSGLTSTNVQDAIDELYEMKSSGGIPPRPVTKILAIKGSASISINWYAPNTYDVDCVKYNVYVYSGSTAPTSFSQFTLVTSTTELSYEYTMPNTSANYYFLIASVSKDDVVQESIDYVTKALTVGTFASTSWETVFEIGKMGLQSTYFSIGDERTISIGGTSYKVKITDFNHDDLADGSGKAPYTFSMSNALATTRAMNSSNTNSGGWTGSAMYSYMETLLNTFPSDLKALIRPVIKKTSAGNQSTSIVESNDKLWLFSEVEVFGATTYSAAGGGSQYPIFTSNSSRIKKQGDSGSACYWWLRSPYASSSAAFCYVYSDGTANYDNASYSFGVSVGFCF